jgi:hypothetical protein
MSKATMGRIGSLHLLQSKLNLLKCVVYQDAPLPLTEPSNPQPIRSAVTVVGCRLDPRDQSRVAIVVRRTSGILHRLESEQVARTMPRMVKMSVIDDGVLWDSYCTRESFTDVHVY